MSNAPTAGFAALLITAIVAPGCGSSREPAPTAAIPSSLLSQARPIGAGRRFQPRATGPVIGRCSPQLGPRTGVHVEVFASNRVVLIPAAIGTRPPRRISADRISAARCYGDIVTLEPTGLVLLRPGRPVRLSDLFRSWGQPLSIRRLASFTSSAGSMVTVFIDGRRWRRAPPDVPLARHSEIVLEVGPRVPPHASYTFPSGT